jgi:uncharacterized protein
VDSILHRLTDLDEIIGALLIGKDGLIVAGALHSDDEEMVGAMSAAIFDSISDYASQTVNAVPRHIILNTSAGIIQVAEVGELLLIVLTRPESNLGRVRLEMKKTCQQLSELVTAS